MGSPKKILRSERGDLLIDSMFGAVVLALIIFSAAAILVATLNAAVGTSRATARAVTLKTALSDALPKISTYTGTPTTTNVTVLGEQVPLTMWRETVSPTLSVLHGAAPRNASIAATACTTPAAVNASSCVTSSVSVQTTRSGITAPTAIPLTAGSGSTLFTFTAPAGATEIRYVFKVTAAPAASTLRFNNTGQAGVGFDVAIPAGQTGYYYGRALVAPGSVLSVTTTGPATYDNSTFLIYKAAP